MGGEGAHTDQARSRIDGKPGGFKTQVDARLVTAAAVAGLAVLPAAADAVEVSRPFERLGDFPVLTDGRRNVIYVPQPGITRIQDTVRGQGFDLTTPRDCRGAPMRLTSVGQGVVLWTARSCEEQAAPTGEIFDLWTRQFSPARLDDAVSGYSDPHLLFPGQIGRHWLVVTTHAPRGGATTVNWRTGEAAPDPLLQSATARHVFDLDSPALVRRMCTPLRRRRHEEDIFPTFKDFQYERPYGLTEGGGESRTLVLQRCGARRPSALIRCRTQLGGFYCFQPQLSAGYITWMTDGDVNAYVLRSRRRYRVGRVTLGRSRRAAVTHTRNRVFVTTVRNSATGERYQTFVAPFRVR